MFRILLGNDPDEGWSDDSHETSEANKFHIAFLELLCEQDVVIVPFPPVPLGAYIDGRDVVLSCTLEGISIRLVADHDSDLSREQTFSNIVYNGLEVRTATGNENADAYFVHGNSLK